MPQPNWVEVMVEVELMLRMSLKLSWGWIETGFDDEVKVELGLRLKCSWDWDWFEVVLRLRLNLNWSRVEFSIAFVRFCLMEYSMVMQRNVLHRALQVKNSLFTSLSTPHQYRKKALWSSLKGKYSKSSTPFCKYCAMEHSMHLQKKKEQHGAY